MRIFWEILRNLTGAAVLVLLAASRLWQTVANGTAFVYGLTPLGRSRLGAIAQHTISEGIRMKIALVFFALIGICVLGLPFTVRGDSSLTGAVQSYITYSLTVVGLLLSILSIFLSRSISDELVGKQIMVLMAKPVARWQYLLGKWLGITLLNLSFLSFSGAVIYGMVHYIRLTHPPLDEIYVSSQVADSQDQQPFSLDRQRLQTEVLTARHATRFILPDFTAAAEREFQERLKNGFYDNALTFNAEEERRRMYDKLMGRWRVLQPLESRVFQFENIECDRSPDNEIQIRYFPDVSHFPPDEILRAEWIIGDRNKGAQRYTVRTRHVNQRYHTVKVPADCVADDRTLSLRFINRNPFANPNEYEHPEPLYPCVVRIGKPYPVECYFVVGSFEGNLLRLLTLMMCKLMFLAAVGLLMTSLFSFPVACLASFMVFTLAGLRSFLSEAIDQVDSDTLTAVTAFGALGRSVFAGDLGAMSESLQLFVVEGIGEVLRVLFFVIPNFAYYDGVETFVNGNNVPLKWVLEGIGELVLLQTTVVIGLAMIVFHRREVAEVSV